MSTKYDFMRDINGYAEGQGLPFAQDGFAATLATNTEQHITVPSNFPNWVAEFYYTDDVDIWVDGITTAVVPSGAFTASTVERCPKYKYVKAGQVLSFITSATTTPAVAVKFYAVLPFTKNG